MRIATAFRVLVRSLFVSFRSSWINSLPLETAIFVPTFGITAITLIERMFFRHVESELLPTHNAFTSLRSKRTAVTRREILNSTPDRRCLVLCPFFVHFKTGNWVPFYSDTVFLRLHLLYRWTQIPIPSVLTNGSWAKRMCSPWNKVARWRTWRSRSLQVLLIKRVFTRRNGT